MASPPFSLLYLHGSDIDIVIAEDASDASDYTSRILVLDINEVAGFKSILKPFSSTIRSPK